MTRSLVFVLSIIALPAIAAESDYVEAYCAGQIEYWLPDRTRIDCLTDSHAVEYDYGRKWGEAIGQSLHYASHTGRRAGIVFIVLTNSDRYGLERARRVIAHYGLPIDIVQVVTTLTID